MRMPSLSSSATTLVKQYGVYHATRLSADKALQSMAASWAQAQNRLSDRVQALEAAQAAAMTALAVRDGEGAALSAEVRAFFGALVTKTHNDRRSPLFSVYFPDGLCAVVDGSTESTANQTLVLLGKLAQETDAELKAYLDTLDAHLKSFQTALQGYRNAQEAQLQTAGRVEQEKIAWLDAYKLDHRTLAQMYYNDPKRAESYFKTSRRKTAPVLSQGGAAAPKPVPVSTATA